MKFICPQCRAGFPRYYQESSGLCCECHTLPRDFHRARREASAGGGRVATMQFAPENSAKMFVRGEPMFSPLPRQRPSLPVKTHQRASHEQQTEIKQ
jgi:hypothetical protein